MRKGTEQRIRTAMEYINQGMNVTAACKKAKISPATFRNYPNVPALKAEAAKAPAKPNKPETWRFVAADLILASQITSASEKIELLKHLIQTGDHAQTNEG